MIDVVYQFRKEVENYLGEAIVELKILGDDNVNSVKDDYIQLFLQDFLQDIDENPPVSTKANLAFPCFVLSKKGIGGSPNCIANKIEKYIQKNKDRWDLLGNVELSGSYVNFIANQKYYKEVLKQIFNEDEEKYEKNKKKWAIEFVSPNTNKPLHLGHARNAFLGYSLSKMAIFAGFNVTRMNLFNDRGVHICKSMLAYKKWGENKTSESENIKPDHFVGKFYQLFTYEAEKNPQLELEAQEMLNGWENNDKEILALWRKMNSWFYKGVNETFARMGIVFDQIFYESDIYKNGKDIIKKALEDNKCYKLSDGAVEVDLEEKKLGKKILLRKDGTAVYIVQDLYLAKKKFNDFDLDKSIYVVADEQKYHFDVLFELLDRFGISNRNKNYHLAYGMVELAEGRMSSRKGTVINIDNILDELRNLALTEIRERENSIDENEKNTRAEKIALAALKYKILVTDKDKKILFDKKEALKFEGDTGPYLLYVYARINSILAKSDFKLNFDQELESDNGELIELIKMMARFHNIIISSVENYNPAILARYLFELSQNFNIFYHKYRIIDTDNTVKKNARLLVTKALQQVLKKGLNLLGIDVLERM